MKKFSAAITIKILLLVTVLSLAMQVCVLAQQKLPAIHDQNDVVKACTLMPLPDGSGKQLVSPMVATSSASFPDYYALTGARQSDGSVKWILMFTIDRAGGYANFVEVANREGKTLAVRPVSQAAAKGRYVQTYMLSFAVPTFEKSITGGFDVTFKGLSEAGKTQFSMPAYFFAGMDQAAKLMIPAPVKAISEAPQSSQATSVKAQSSTAVPPGVTPDAGMKVPAKVSAEAKADANVPATPASQTPPATTPAQQPASVQVSPFLKNSSIGKPAPAPVIKEDPYSLPGLTPENSVGKELIFTPVSPKIQRNAYDYKFVRGLGVETKTLPYDKYVGRIAVIENVTSLSKYVVDNEDSAGSIPPGTQRLYDNRSGYVFAVKMKDTGDKFLLLLEHSFEWFKNLAELAELEFAQKKLLNQKLWLNTLKVYTYDAASDVQTTVSVPKWTGVLVKDVTLGDGANPVRLVLQLGRGQECYLDVCLSKSRQNQIGRNFFGEETLSIPFEKVLLDADPREKYKWPEDVLAAVTQNKIALGFTPEQVIAAWGEPNQKGQNVMSGLKVETWFYDGKLISFANGKCNSIADVQPVKK